MISGVKNITVLMGGWSSEREVSVSSGRYVSSVLRRMGYGVYELIVEKDLRFITDKLYESNPDFIFNLLHGTGGEDGVIQGILEIFGKPYSNSGVLSSAICFNKSICKAVAKLSGALVPECFEIDKKDIQKLGREISVRYPFVVKPEENGSSVGVFVIFDDKDLNGLQSQEWKFGERVLVEEYIAGREFTTLIINGKAIGSIEITFKNKFYDYSSKYEIGGSSHISSFELNQNQTQEMHKTAENIYQACRCRGVARADFRCNDNGAYFLELNTQTGMTELSLAPDIARFNGISIEELLEMNIRSY